VPVGLVGGGAPFVEESAWRALRFGQSQLSLTSTFGLTQGLSGISPYVAHRVFFG
jgi:hypothetical protein